MPDVKYKRYDEEFKKNAVNILVYRKVNSHEKQ